MVCVTWKGDNGHGLKNKRSGALSDVISLLQILSKNVKIMVTELLRIKSVNTLEIISSEKEIPESTFIYASYSVARHEQCLSVITWFQENVI